MTRRRYFIDDDGTRHLIVPLDGFDGFIVRWTSECSGCTEYSDGHRISGPCGCEECGYTGKCRRQKWVPIDADAYQRWLEWLWMWRDLGEVIAQTRARAGEGKVGRRLSLCGCADGAWPCPTHTVLTTCVVCGRQDEVGLGCWAVHTDNDATPVCTGPCWRAYAEQKDAHAELIRWSALLCLGVSSEFRYAKIP